ncbi:hypothetical protein N7485_009651 [Penicillium canescens]|nr:hypothetical protein N7485_009651 [Penicillium canescens]
MSKQSSRTQLYLNLLRRLRDDAFYYGITVNCKSHALPLNAAAQALRGPIRSGAIVGAHMVHRMSPLIAWGA